MSRTMGWIGPVLIIAVVCAVSSTAPAAIITLEDQNATATFDTSTDAGLFEWVVDGVDHMHKQWFWFRVGNGGGEAPISSLDHDDTIGVDLKVSDGNLNPGNDRLVARYRDPGDDFFVVVDFVLGGGSDGSGRADLTEVISIFNTSNQTLNFHFFEYVDFDLNETIGDDTIVILNGNTARQTDPVVTVSETVVTPQPSRFEAAVFDSTLLSLNDGNPTTLNNQAGPLADVDATWAFQWDMSIPAGGSFLISKDKLLIAIPEPATIGLLGLAGGLILARRRRKCL